MTILIEKEDFYANNKI